MRKSLGKWMLPLALLAAVISFIFSNVLQSQPASLSLSEIPEFDGTPYAVLTGNVPDFSDKDLVAQAFEAYSELDALNRCGTAIACVGISLMPTEERGSIGQVKPTGWQTVKYEIVDGKYLYNRCHLIGFQLTGENANECNLITGTRYLNVEGMLPFENMVADYVKETGNHVLYRVTPHFIGDELVCRGVQIEAMSVEDAGRGICFNVYAYNVQPGIDIDYATGQSALAGSKTEGSQIDKSYVLNTNSKKFHLPGCESAVEMKESNRMEYHGDRRDLIEQGYVPCGSCKP